MMILGNMGTPLMWASISWLALGNLFIGLGEGAILARLTKAKGVKPYLLMIAANYFSAWAGVGATSLLQPWLDRVLTVDTLLPGLVVLMVAAWVWTMILEFPLVWLAFPPRLRRFRVLPWRASLIVQTVSYGALALWLGSCSSLSLVTKTSRAGAAELAGGRGATVYYLTPDGGALRRIRLDGTGDAEVAKTQGVYAHNYGFDRLQVHAVDGASWLEWSGEGSPRLAPLAASDWVATYAAAYSDSTSGRAFDSVALPGSDEYQVACGFWSSEGLRVSHAGETTRLAVNMPFAMWYVKTPTVFAGGLVVFEAGRQVLLYDAATRRLALLARGCRPLVIPDGSPPAGFVFPNPS